MKQMHTHTHNKRETETHMHTHKRACVLIHTHPCTGTGWANCPPGLVQGRINIIIYRVRGYPGLPSIFLKFGHQGEYGKVRYGIFGREITIHTVIYSVYIGFWPTLYMAIHWRNLS